MHGKRFPLSTCKCCGFKGHVANDCYSPLRATKIQWRQIPYHKPSDTPLTCKERQRTRRMEDKFEAEALEISLGLQAYDPNNPPPDPVILQPELHCKPCPVCDKFGHKAVDCSKLCPLYIKTGACNHIMAGPQWKDHPHYIIAEEDLPNFDDLTTIDHPHFDLILLKSLSKDIEMELEKLRSMPIKGGLHELLPTV
jgi:hypothetical protein